MGNEHLNKLSDELKSAREKKKLSIDNIFTKTRIDKKYLTAIENGNFSIMPEVYIRAFIKEYSKTVGLDPDDVLMKYELAKEGKPFSEKETEEQEKPKKEKIEKKIHEAESVQSNVDLGPENKSKNMTIYYLIGAFSMLLTIFIVYKLFLMDETDKIVTEKPFEQIIEEKNDPDGQSEKELDQLQEKIEPSDISIKGPTPIERNQEVKEAAVTEVKQPLKEGQLALTIEGNDKSWIRVVSDNKDNVEFIIDKGMIKVFYAKEKFYLHVGNSAGVKLYLNNKDLLFSGSDGKVRKIFVTENGIEYLRRTPVLDVEQESN
jgi:cytoskeletal protein RodZ